MKKFLFTRFYLGTRQKFDSKQVEARATATAQHDWSGEQKKLCIQPHTVPFRLRGRYRFRFHNLRFYTVLLLIFLSPLCLAMTSPSTQLQQVANRMISQLEGNKSQLHNMRVIRRIVNQTLIPNVDLDRMSASVVGRIWLSATPAQKAQFEKEFSYLVTTTYASALSSYDGDTVQFYPMRGNFAAQQTVRVNSVIIRKNGQRIPISYDVVRGSAQWKVYDFSIEHVSMVQSYRSQFSNVLAQGGMTALLARLQSHNQRGK